MAVSASVALQRRKDGDSWGWVLPIAISLLPAARLLYYTRSKAAGATALLGAVAFAVLWLLGDRPRRYARAAFFAGVGAFCWAPRRWLGTGWHIIPSPPAASRSAGITGSPPAGSSPGTRSSASAGKTSGRTTSPFACPSPRRKSATRTIFVRAFVELGAIGGLLMIAWMLLLWWELTGPLAQTTGAAAGSDNPSIKPLTSSGGNKASAAPVLSYSNRKAQQTSAAAKDSGYPAFAVVIALAVIAVGIHIAISFDWEAEAHFCFSKRSGESSTFCFSSPE